jgi:hypothetical protein
MQYWREELKTKLCELQVRRDAAVGKVAKRAIGCEMLEINRLLGQSTEQAMHVRRVFYNIARQELSGEEFKRLLTLTWREIRLSNLLRSW